MTAPHIGQRVWRFDLNRRVYERDADGNARGGPIWREYWEPLVVIGETARSWLVGPEWMAKSPERAMKIAKKDWPGSLATSEEDIERVRFVDQRHKLADRLKLCTDYDTLKAIEKALDAGQRT